VSSVAKKPCQDYQIIYDVDDTRRGAAVAVVGVPPRGVQGPGSVGPATPVLVAGELGIRPSRVSGYVARVAGRGEWRLPVH